MVVSVEIGGCRVNVMPSTVEHLKAGLGLFSPCTVSKGKSIGAYYGSFVYADLSEQLLSM